MMYSFGPVPSRRLGKSLGINNIPMKNCTYSCTYCQLNANFKPTITQKEFYDPYEIVNEVREKIKKITNLDYITIVPDGEASLDLNLDIIVDELKKINIPVAIITNSSLIDIKMDTLLKFDLVSLKVDAVNENIWRKINRPHKKLVLDKILDGILEFSKIYNGKLITETMLVNNINYDQEIIDIANYIFKINNLHKAYLGIPTRPPTVKGIKPPNSEVINNAYNVFINTLGFDKVGLLLGYEGNEFTVTGNIEESLLSIMSVHPMREDAIYTILNQNNIEFSLIEQLIKNKKIRKLRYNNNNYYITVFPKSNL